MRHRDDRDESFSGHAFIFEKDLWADDPPAVSGTTRPASPTAPVMVAANESAPVAPPTGGQHPVMAVEPTNMSIDDAPPPILKLPGQVVIGAQSGGQVARNRCPQAAAGPRTPVPRSSDFSPCSSPCHPYAGTRCRRLRSRPRVGGATCDRPRPLPAVLRGRAAARSARAVGEGGSSEGIRRGCAGLLLRRCRGVAHPRRVKVRHLHGGVCGSERTGAALCAAAPLPAQAQDAVTLKGHSGGQPSSSLSSGLPGLVQRYLA